MTTQTRPPAGLELKNAPTMLAPRPGTPSPDTGSVAPEGIVELIAAVTGIADDVADIIQPGAFAATLTGTGAGGASRRRVPKVCRGHDWSTPIGRVLAITELLPGDRRLPRKTGDGRPWPREAGALVATVQLNMSSTAGREAFESIKFFGPAESAFSIGYKVTPGGSRKRGGIRYIHDLDLFEISPVLFGAARYATGLSIKSGRPADVEFKATPSTGAMRRAARAADTGARIYRCSLCGQPAAAFSGPLPAAVEVICTGCVGVADALADAELTTEEAYARAQREEITFHAEPDGELVRGPRPRWGAA